MQGGSESTSILARPDCDSRETVTKRSPGSIRGSYGSIMKNVRVLSPLLISLSLASAALAQAGSPEVPDTPQPQSSVAAQPESSPVAGVGASGEDKLISQARHYPRGPRRPMGPHRGYAYQGFPPPPGLSPVGALIGFGIGAAAGASNCGQSTVGTHVALGLIGGGLGALIGGAIGAVANPFLHTRRVYRPSGTDEDEEAGLRSNAKKAHPQQSVSARPAPSQPASPQANAEGPLNEPAVP
jgi:hypothetical protein